MNIKKFFFLFLFASAAFAATIGIYKPSSKDGSAVKKKPVKNTEMLSFETGDSYEKEWEAVEAFIKQDLTQSALQLVEPIYIKAKKENNTVQIVKALMYRMKLESVKEENALEKSITKLQEELKTAKYPLKPVLHSMLAETFWNYYTNNRWKFYNRSQTANFKNDDISTWDLTTLTDQTIKQFNLSLRSTDSLMRTPLNIYDEVIINNNKKATEQDSETRKLRPTLYDFLAHRAADFFASEEAGITKPVYQFEIDKEFYFREIPDDTDLDKLKTKDSLSLKFYAMKLLTEISLFHQEDKDPEAFIDADLKRIKFVYYNAVIDNKDSLYLKALQRLEIKYIHHPFSTQISYEIADYYSQKGNAYGQAGNYPAEDKWFNKKAMEICETVFRRFPESYGAKLCNVLKSQLLRKTMSINIERVNLPNKPFRALLTFTNVKHVYLRLIKIDSYQKFDFRSYVNDEERLTKYIALPVLKAWDQELPDDGDLCHHSAEIKMPEVDAGYYLVLMSADKNFSVNKNGISYTTFWSSAISYVNREDDKGGQEVYVMDRESGLPLKGVTAQLYTETYNFVSRTNSFEKNTTYTSDENGYFFIPAHNEGTRYYNIEFTRSTGGDILYTGDQISQYQVQPEQKKKRLKTFYFTDRAIYRPGQTVFFKGIVIETDGETNAIKTKQKIATTLYNANSQKVSTLNLVTNEYGSVSGSFVIPDNGLNGQMYLMDQTESQVYFSVEDYKRPKFEVIMEPVKGVFKLNDSVIVPGKAKSYSGANVDGAQVKYHVVRTASYPAWCSFFWIGGYFPSTSMEITSGITTTNDTGGFVINFKAIPDLSISKKYVPTFNYSVSADVVDINGETHSVANNVSVGYTAMNLSVNLPGMINKAQTDTFQISSTNLNGEFEPAKGKIIFYRLNEPSRIFRDRLWTKPDKFLMTKEEFYKLFPNDIYNNENDRSEWMDKRVQVAAINFDTDKNKKLALSQLQEWKQGVYVMEASSKDKFGMEVKDMKYFTLYSTTEKTIPVIASESFMEVKTSGEPGEKAAFLVGTSETNVKLLFEVEHKGVIIKKEWMTLNKEQKLIEIPIEEKYRGGFGVHFLMVRNSRLYPHDIQINVPYTNTQLNLQFETFRDKLLPGQKEEWKIKIRDKKGEKVAAEMVAGLYDASLDAFRSNSWYMDLYNNSNVFCNWNTRPTDFYFSTSGLFDPHWNNSPEMEYKYYDELNWFGGYSRLYDNISGMVRYREANVRYSSPVVPGGSWKNLDYAMKAEAEAPMATTVSGSYNVRVMEVSACDGSLKASEPYTYASSFSDGTKEKSVEKIIPRTNLNETAFFFPQLQTDEQGNVIIRFTVPESLTKWKMMGFAHTKDLKLGQIENTLVTQKQLMVVPNAPRFLREGDKISFTSKVSNLSGKELTGDAQLFLYDAETMKDISSQFKLKPGISNLKLAKGLSQALSWDLTIPEGVGAVTYKVVAKAGNYSDGEQHTLPVLSNRMLVTESLPLAIRSKQTKVFTLEKLLSNGNASSTLRNHKLTLEFTANPAWYAVQALPYLMEYPYECAEQTFSRYYANSLASHIVNSSPKIKMVFDSWKNNNQGEALLSNLEKNQDLKSVLLEETPWVMDAKNETERKKRLGLLFDLNHMADQSGRAFAKLEKMQTSNGGWPWFEGMPDDRYITQHIICGMGHLDHLRVNTIRTDNRTWNMITKGIHYLDDRIREDYEWMMKHGTDPEKDHLNQIQIQYLYARSYFKDIAIETKNQKAFDYYKGQAEKYWLNNNRYMQGMIALALNRYTVKNAPATIMKSLKENALISEEMGMYWKENYEGYYWYESPIEEHALLIEAFDEVSNDKKAVDDLKVWLLKSKQTQDWKTTKATAEACYALLLRGTDWLATQSNVDITVGSQKVDPKQLISSDGKKGQSEAGTGYFKTYWNGADIKPEMGKVTVSKKDEGVSWGALYWQYFEQLDKITPHKTPLHAEKKLFVERNSASGLVIEPVTAKTILKPGDKIKVRIELRVDRNMEYVHMKDMRSSGFEPINVFSQYKYQDGLGYYESTRDAATNFFFNYLNKGTYVFEYPLRVTHNGDFSNGITTVQCMYAPEFTSHSEGIRVKVGQ